MEHATAGSSFAALAYLIAGVCFILALRGLSSPTSSQRGNRFGMIGMAIAVVTTLVTHVPTTETLVVGYDMAALFQRVDTLAVVEILAAIGIGAAIGRVSTSRRMSRSSSSSRSAKDRSTSRSVMLTAASTLTASVSSTTSPVSLLKLLAPSGLM